VVAYDRDGRDILAVEVKSRAIAQPEDLVTDLMHRAPAIDLWMLVDPREIRVYVRGRENGAEGVAELDTRQVLAKYDEQFGRTTVFEPYLTTLVEAWLRDLAYHWKHADPPGSHELQSSGLADRLRGGSTEREVLIGGDALR
jgi:hypothetical protein